MNQKVKKIVKNASQSCGQRKTKKKQEAKKVCKVV